MLHCCVSSIYRSGPEHCYFMFSGAWRKYYSLIMGSVVDISPAPSSAVRSFEPSLGERHFWVKAFVCYCMASRQMYLSENTTPSVHVVLQFAVRWSLPTVMCYAAWPLRASLSKSFGASSSCLVFVGLCHLCIGHLSPGRKVKRGQKNNEDR